MSSNNKSSGTGILGGKIGLTSVGSGLYAYFTIPSLSGLKGVFGAAMIGMGTSLTAGIGVIAGGLAGGLVGGGLGAIFNNAKAGAIGGAILFGLAGGVYGIFEGYGAAKDIVVNGTENKQNKTQHKSSNPLPIMMRQHLKM